MNDSTTAGIIAVAVFALVVVFGAGMSLALLQGRWNRRIDHEDQQDRQAKDNDKT